LLSMSHSTISFSSSSLRRVFLPRGAVPPDKHLRSAPFRIFNRH
jgi:hypothetical protein